MPLVRISLVEGKSPDYVRSIADGVHAALVETYQVPPDDRFQIIEQLDRSALIYDADYVGVHRTEDVVFIHIVASDTRDTKAKQALYRQIAARLSEKPGLRPEDVQVVISSNSRADWSFGKGLATYVGEAA